MDYPNTAFFCRCVCQWAFTNYIDKAGGCDHIQDIACESVNIKALKGYANDKAGDFKIQAAYDCLIKRCKVDVAKLELELD